MTRSRLIIVLYQVVSGHGFRRAVTVINDLGLQRLCRNPYWFAGVEGITQNSRNIHLTQTLSRKKYSPRGEPRAVLASREIHRRSPGTRPSGYLSEKSVRVTR